MGDSPKGGSSHPPPPSAPLHTMPGTRARYHPRFVSLGGTPKQFFLRLARGVWRCLSASPRWSESSGCIFHFAHSRLGAELLLHSLLGIFKCLPAEAQGAVSPTPDPEGTGRKPEHQATIRVGFWLVLSAQSLASPATLPGGGCPGLRDRSREVDATQPARTARLTPHCQSPVPPIDSFCPEDLKVKWEDALWTSWPSSTFRLALRTFVLMWLL